jgi:hypothetical protein
MPADRRNRIIRTARDRNHPYQIIHTAFANDRRLSADARGVMVFLLTKPDHWQIRVDAIQKEFAIGRDKAYRILGQLIDAGYLIHERTHDERGRVVWGDYLLFENPDDALAPFPENPEMVEPDPCLPYTENTEMDETGVSPVAEPSAPFPGLPYTENTDHESCIDHESCTDRTLPPPPNRAKPETESAPGGGGGSAGEETIAILQAAAPDFFTAAEYADIPPDVARAALAQADTHPQAATKLAALTAGLLKRYRGGTWKPTAQEHRHGSSARPAGRQPAANRPAGSGPPPGVKTPTADDLASWGLDMEKARARFGTREG